MPEVTIFTALFFGFFLGIKHALDADHIVAVTAIVSRSNSLLRSALVGSFSLYDLSSRKTVRKGEDR